MAAHKLKRLPKNTFEIEVTVGRDEVAQEYSSAFNYLKSQLTVEGFRTGKVPVDIAKKHISEQAIYEQIIRTILPKLYEQIIKKEGLKPVVSPKIEIIKAKKDEDWLLKLTTAEKPVVHLNNYQEVVKEAKSIAKKAEIWVPGKDKDKEKPKVQDSQVLNKVLDALLEKLKVEISDLLIEEELNQRLTRLVDDIQKVGLTVEAYLKSKSTTMDKIRESIKKEIESVYSLEFILGEIAEQEKIIVEEKDLEQVMAKIKDPKEKEAAQKNAYFYATLIRKQKTIDYLLSL